MARLCWRKQGTGLQMKRLSYPLIFLLMSAQVDDTWASVVLPSAPLAADNDEYLPAQRPPRGEQPSSRAKLVFDVVRPWMVPFPLVPGSGPAECNLTTPFTPPPLYVFMSLQI